MKKKIQEYIKSVGGSSSYSGRTKTLYIIPRNIQEFEIEMDIIEKFGHNIGFKLNSIERWK
jgi:hypothetical protein